MRVRAMSNGWWTALGFGALGLAGVLVVAVIASNDEDDDVVVDDDLPSAQEPPETIEEVFR
jgi:hypothetical protein